MARRIGSTATGSSDRSCWSVTAKSLPAPGSRACSGIDSRSNLPDGPCVLRKTSLSGRRFGVFVGDRAAGEMAQTGFFARRIRLSLSADWPDAIQIFLFWLALVIWNREAAAAAG